MDRAHLKAVLANLAVFWIAAGCIQHAATPPDQRPARWAQPLSRPGLSNFYEVTDTLYRGAQPGPEGFQALQAMGVRTVVNLRSSHADDERIGSLPLKEVRIRCLASDIGDDETAEFLKVVSDPANHPVFVHCQQGSDRTGLMCAVYRMAVQGWTREEAIEEMTKGGFGYHIVWVNLIDYLEEVDTKALRKKAGIAK